MCSMTLCSFSPTCTTNWQGKVTAARGWKCRYSRITSYRQRNDWSHLYIITFTAVVIIVCKVASSDLQQIFISWFVENNINIICRFKPLLLLVDFHIQQMAQVGMCRTMMISLSSSALWSVFSLEVAGYVCESVKICGEIAILTVSGSVVQVGNEETG